MNLSRLRSLHGGLCATHQAGMKNTELRPVAVGCSGWNCEPHLIEVELESLAKVADFPLYTFRQTNIPGVWYMTRGDSSTIL